MLPPDQSHSENAAPRTRRTRFVCISDTHNHTVKLPKGDVLIHAGDLTNAGGHSELRNTLDWLDKADFECKIVVAGNHDLTLDHAFPHKFPSRVSNRAQTPDECRALLSQTKTLLYLAHESRTVTLSSPTGPRTTFRLFASPLSPEFGTWAFAYRRDNGPAIWDAVPLDTDVLVTHGPPHKLLDYVDRVDEHTGCASLRAVLWRVRPRLAVFGHIHEGRGAARVRWDLGVQEPYRLESFAKWEDPAPEGARNALCDLTGRSQGSRLDNDGSVGEAEGAGRAPAPGTGATGWMGDPAPISGVRGMGGDPYSPLSDQLALQGRMGRRETCVVNAAIMSSPFHGRAARKLNKPIVVDLDLPVWEE